MTVLVCTATLIEARACLRGIKQAGLSHRFDVLHTGVGPHRTAQAAHRYLTTTAGAVELVVSAGFAGSADDQLEVGEWITASSLAAIEPQTTAEAVASITDARLLSMADRAVRPCGVLSVPRLAALPSRSELASHALQGDAAGLLAVDMESAWLGRVAAQHGVALMVLRMITDTPRKPLPAFVARWIGAMDEPTLGRQLVAAAPALSETLRGANKAVCLVRNGLRWRAALQRGWQQLAPQVDRYASLARMPAGPGTAGATVHQANNPCP